MKFLFKSFFVYFFLNELFITCAQNRNTLAGDGFWTQVSTMRMNQIIWVNDTLYSSRNPLYQSNGGVYRSIDGGINWDTLFSISDVLSGGLRIFIHPTNHRILYLIYGALYKSTNAGQSWNIIFSSFGPLVRLGINPKNPNIMYVTKSIPYGTVFKTTDGGNFWNEVNTGLPNEEYFQAGPIDINIMYPDTILLGTNTGVYRSTNGGASWDTTIVKGFIPGINIHPLSPNIAFASTTYDWATYKTTDFGLTWYKSLGSSAVNTFVFNKINHSILYNSGNSKSTDVGDTWFKIDSLSGWTDLAADTEINTTLFGTVGEYGLYTYTDIISSINDAMLTDTEYYVKPYPNPFNYSTIIQFIVQTKSFVTVIIYNSLGQKVNILLEKTELQEGRYSYSWNGKDENGLSVASGNYFCNLIFESLEKFDYRTIKLVFVK